jgi:hypothetical protein
VTLGAEWSCSIVDEILRVDADTHHHVIYSHPSSESGRDTRLEYQGHQSLSSAENQVYKPHTVDQTLIVSIQPLNCTGVGHQTPGLTGHSITRDGGKQRKEAKVR